MIGRPFGTTSQSEQIVTSEISAFGLHASIINWGASVQDLRLDGHPHPLVLGFTTLQDYIDHGQHHGATAGRVINRIGGGTAVIDGTAYSLDVNQDGRHMLHGGHHGFGLKAWQITEHQHDTVLLTLTDPDGSMGFPGTVQAGCRYSIVARDDGPALRVELTATTDAPTLVNLGHHSYFRLDDTGDVRAHFLSIDADHYLPCAPDSLPLGPIEPVEGTRFDFRNRRPVGESYDHNFCLARDRRDLTRVAHLDSPHSGISMQLSTTEPGLQLYTGQNLGYGGISLDGTPCGPFTGLCLEPQFWPNAPHQAAFPSIDLMPGDRYQQITEFTFTRG